MIHRKEKARPGKGEEGYRFSSIVSRSRKLTGDGYPYEPSSVPVYLHRFAKRFASACLPGFTASLFSHSENSVRFLFCLILFLSVACFLSLLTISITRSIRIDSVLPKQISNIYISRETDLPFYKLFISRLTMCLFFNK